MKILVIGDTQCKPDEDLSYMSAIGNYIVSKRPDVIVHIGDNFDFPSLSTYDKGKRSFEGRRLKDDIEAGKEGLKLLLSPLKKLQNKQRQNKKKPYSPRLVFTLGNHECLTPDTDVLTKTGWKNITEVTTEDEVLTYNSLETGEWHKPDVIYSKDYDGDIHKYHSRSFSLQCTPSHRIYYKTSNGNLQVKESKDVVENFSIISSVDCRQKGVEVSLDELKLLGWMCTDSHFVPNTNNVVLYQRVSNAHKIRDLLVNLNIKFTEKTRDRDITEICGKKLKKKPEANVEFYFQNPTKFVTSNKYLPEWVDDLTQEQWKVFLDVLIDADGSLPTKCIKSRVFYGQKRICEDLQRFAITHNWSASLTEYRPNQWRVNLVDLNTRRQEGIKKEVVHYSGKVWCLNIRNSNFMIRHNNKCHITGNCRFDRLAEDMPELTGLVGTSTLGLEDMGWEVVPFLKPVDIEGIYFVHYLANPMTGKPYGGVALNQLKTVGRSFVVGHKQCLDIAIRPTLDGKHQLGVVVGACYPFDESYKGHQGNFHFRGVVMLHEVEDGFALPMPVSLSYLQQHYGENK